MRKSNLRRRADRGPGSRRREDVMAEGGSGSLLGAAVRLVLTGTTAPHDRGQRGELDDIPMPDLLSPGSNPGPDPGALTDLLDLAFLGRASGDDLDRELDRMPVGSNGWSPEHFADDLFLAELVRGCLQVEIGGRLLPTHAAYIERALSNPPTDASTVRYRQAILRELEHRASLREGFEKLIGQLVRLLSILRASRDDARLKPVRFRLDVLRALRGVVRLMAEGFEGATSGLQRLHSSGKRIRDSRSFQRMEALLDHNDGMASLQLGMVIGADGKAKHLEIQGLEELTGNRFFRRPLRRWWDRLRIFYHRYDVDADALVDRLVMGVYQEVAPAMARVVQMLGQLEVYQAARTFAEHSRSRGMGACLPEVDNGIEMRLEGLFNPLLTTMMDRPVPSDLMMASVSPIMLVTGPNSGGKTRLLQAVGIAQILGQSGLYVPCTKARMSLVAGLFASIVEVDRADQSEGRLGTELVRLRNLFESVPRGSLVLLDELCSGTNPSEAIEIVEMVLRLLGRIEPVAFVTTHFLDFALDLHSRPSSNGLGFLQAEVDAERGATFRFVKGVATTSLAVGTAERLGVTFEELERRLEERRGDSD